MHKTSGSKACEFPYSVHVKNTFLDVMVEDCGPPNMKRRGSAPGRLLPDPSDVYPAFHSEGPTFFSEAPYSFAAFSSEGLDGLADDDAADTSGGQPAASGGDAGGSPEGEGVAPAEGGSGGLAPEGAGAAAAPATQAEDGARAGRGCRRPCKSKRQRCQAFLDDLERSLAATPDLDVDQLQIPGFVNVEWIRWRVRGVAAGGAAPRGQQ